MLNRFQFACQLHLIGSGYQVVAVLRKILSLVRQKDKDAVLMTSAVGTGGGALP